MNGLEPAAQARVADNSLACAAGSNPTDFSILRDPRLMRIVVHDYAGHPNEVYMSRELARRGHDVLHLYAGSIETPRGELVKTPRDAPTFEVEGVFLKRFQKHTYVRRQLQEIQ